MTSAGFSAVAVVLDRSGSMEAIRQATIEGFNEFLAAQKAVAGEAAFTLAQFDHEYEVAHDFRPLREVEPLTAHTYVPRGSTALLDAIGRTVNSLGARLSAMPAEQRPSQVIVAIITDGLENFSREFTRAKIFEMITHQREKYAWQFLFLAANQDAIAAGEELGVLHTHAANFNATPGSSRRMFRAVGQNAAFGRSLNMPVPEFSESMRAVILDDSEDEDSPAGAAAPAHARAPATA